MIEKFSVLLQGYFL